MPVHRAKTVVSSTPATPIKSSSAHAALLGSVGMTQIVSTQADDASINIGDIGFNFSFFGANYRSNIFAGSNSYITFGFGSTVYNGLGANSPGRGLLVNAADRGWNAVFIKADDPGKSFRVRFEGSIGTSGPSSHIWELTLYADSYLQLVTGDLATSGVGMLSDGTTGTNLLLAANSSYVFTPTFTPVNTGFSMADGSYTG